MSVTREFREFVTKGNVVDLAVGVIIGGAFGKIVASLVGDVIMPPIGLALGGVDFTQLKVVLQAADPTSKIAEVAIRYGLFLNTLIEFLIVAFVIFMMVRVINRLRRTEVAAPPGPTPSEVLLTQIRDLLQKQG